MPDDNSDDDGFTFTDEDFARRYETAQPVRHPPAATGSSAAASEPADPVARPIHGGGNSFMRARRRRRAACRGL